MPGCGCHGLSGSETSIYLEPYLESKLFLPCLGGVGPYFLKASFLEEGDNEM